VTAASVPTATSDVAFGVVFGLFIVAFAVLSFITVRWAVRRDRAGRVAWQRRVYGSGGPADDPPAQEAADGRPPRGRGSPT